LARRWLSTVVAPVVAAAAVLVTAGPAQAAEVYPRPADDTWVVTGHGNGHGHGMSQYGALGAAKAGRTWQEIVGFYYRGTTLGSIGNPTIRVRVASLGSSVQAQPQTGLSISWDGTNPVALRQVVKAGEPTVARWRLVPDAKVVGTPTRVLVQYQTSGSTTWRLFTRSPGQVAMFLNPSSGTVTTYRSGATTVYRGQVRAALIGSAGAETLVPVVALPMESYLRTVVPGEVFPSWPQATLRAQSVAARSFAEHHRRYAPLSPTFYDVYDDVRSQVFKPTSVGGVSNEAASTNEAIAATANTSVLYEGKPAFTQFSASSGGWTSAGSQPYLVAQRDDWDAVAENPYHTWTSTVPVSRLESAYPAIGSFQKLAVTGRNGLGDLGGRVLTATLTGTRGSVNVTGSQLRSTLGIGRSDWFQPRLESASSYPRDVTGDRELDVLAVEAATGALRVYPTSGTGTWRTPVIQESGTWNGYAKALTAGAWDADAISDVLVQDSGGNLYLRRGNGNGTFASPVRIGSGWQINDLVLPVGDFDGDGFSDLLARRASGGALILYAGNGVGGFRTWRQVGGGWEIFSAVLGPGDFDGDGNVDVLARAKDGLLHLYPGNGSGGWKPRRTIGSGWQGFTALTALGDFDGDGAADVLARTSGGTLYLYPGNGAGGWKPRRAVGGGWQIFSRVLL
jgi:stage II sporulation protein D